ncbi:Olfactory receptor 7G2 [Sciurus carolinensis]|uniref:Olfactory receptor 7G2 n=1 Tax=Sciurus carolinensis TaxID=30640 RepID=A0AA41N960_SCICA|nr:Olfactory receptor 7G2 [Sciurus carolinensis]
MDPTNQTAISKFLLLGLTEDPALQSLIFSLFHPICLVTILGNLLIILAIYSDSHLHTPMYFFLCNLSFNDICISMTTIPKMLVNILTGDQSITNTGCLTQVAFVMLFSYWDNFLFAVMAYDRYVAICHPLRYTVIMKPCLASCWLWSPCLSVLWMPSSILCCCWDCPSAETQKSPNSSVNLLTLSSSLVLTPSLITS